jgi:hypothetical protein
LAGVLLGRRLQARQARRHPQQAAARERTRQARRLAAEWPLAQTLVTATVAAMAGAGLADYQQAAG